MTWSYLPIRQKTEPEMLAAIGVKKRRRFICRPAGQYPSPQRFKPACTFKRGRSSLKFAKLAAANANPGEYVRFLGAGAYDHFVFPVPWILFLEPQ